MYLTIKYMKIKYYYSNIHYENWNISCEDEEHITLEKIKILEKL